MKSSEPGRTRSATCLGAAAHRHRGFTAIELVMVIVIVGVLAVVILPRLNTDTFDEASFRSQTLAALRLAQKTAVSHRRLVCASLTAATVTLTLATANPASTCGTPLNAPDGDSAYARSPSPATLGLSASPAAQLYFQPSGAVTTDGAGTTPSDFTISITGGTPIRVVGLTGHVD